MTRILIAVLAGFSWCAAFGAAVPESIQRWQKQAQYFESLSTSDEQAFKKALRSYYTTIYRGKRLQEWVKWIDSGSTESEHYSSVFDGLKDTHFGPIKTLGKNAYQVNAIQASCYSLEYNPPTMESVVADWKISNLTQSQVDAWLSQQKPGDGTICLKTEWNIQIRTSAKDALIESDKWEKTKSTATLSPN